MLLNNKNVTIDSLSLYYHETILEIDINYKRIISDMARTVLI